MDFEDYFNEYVKLEQKKFDLAKAAAKKRRYMNLFNLSINIISNLNHVRKLIKKIKKT